MVLNIYVKAYKTSKGLTVLFKFKINLLVVTSSGKLIDQNLTNINLSGTEKERGLYP
jgi:hypothetical protein